MSRYDLSEFEWRVIAPLLPSKPRGVARVDDCRVLALGFAVSRPAGALRAAYDLLQSVPALDQGGVWDRIMDAITDPYGGNVRMIDGTSVRVHHSAATLKKATQIAVLDEAREVLLRKSML